VIIPKEIHEATCKRITREFLEKNHPNLMKALDKIGKSDHKRERTYVK